MPSTVSRPDHRVHGGGDASDLSPRTVAPAGDWIDRLAAARPEEFAELFHERSQTTSARWPGCTRCSKPHRNGAAPTEPGAAPPSWTPWPAA